MISQEIHQTLTQVIVFVQELSTHKLVKTHLMSVFAFQVSRVFVLSISKSVVSLSFKVIFNFQILEEEVQFTFDSSIQMNKDNLLIQAKFQVGPEYSL